MGELKIRNGQLGMRFGTKNLSQISVRFVTDYGNKSLLLLLQKEIIFVANIY
jgi:hypothetical protein